jgi:hypothetical protein
MTRIKNQIEFITCWTRRINSPKQQPKKNIIECDNYIYLIWILNVNHGFELWAKSPFIIKVLINN